MRPLLLPVTPPTTSWQLATPVPDWAAPEGSASSAPGVLRADVNFLKGGVSLTCGLSAFSRLFSEELPDTHTHMTHARTHTRARAHTHTLLP